MLYDLYITCRPGAINGQPHLDIEKIFKLGVSPFCKRYD